MKGGLGVVALTATFSASFASAATIQTLKAFEAFASVVGPAFVGGFGEDASILIPFFILSSETDNSAVSRFDDPVTPGEVVDGVTFSVDPQDLLNFLCS